MPSQYYQIRQLKGVRGSKTPDSEAPNPRRRLSSLAESFNQRIVGSRFQEVNRDSVAYGRLPMGSQVVLEKNGQMGAASMTESPLPDTAPYGPHARQTSWDTAAFNDDMPPPQWWTHQPGDSIPEVAEEAELSLGEDWVDVMDEAPEAVQHGDDYNPDATPARRRPRPPRSRNVNATDDSRRETFPLRKRTDESTEQRPPHLRVQAHGPFVRPLSGLNHDDLTRVYNDISLWRGKLKVINNEIADVQRDCYNDIADGARVKGWLMVGRGLRFLPGIELIEGRAKEDVRWDELQNEGGRMRTFAFYSIVVIVGVLLGICSEWTPTSNTIGFTDSPRSDRCGGACRSLCAGVRSLLPLLPALGLGQLPRCRSCYMLGCRVRCRVVHVGGRNLHQAYVSCVSCLTLVAC